MKGEADEREGEEKKALRPAKVEKSREISAWIES